MTCVFTVLALVLFACTAHSEVIELQGTVKAIDAEARSLTVVRKTPKGEKVLELEVAKNAGDISGIEAGDKISFSYNPDAEIVTKITDAAQADAVEALQGVWVAIAVARDGSLLTKKELQEQSRRIIIEGNVFKQEETHDGKRTAFSGQFNVDPSAATFDFAGKGPKGHPLRLLGIYEIKGDTLRLCYRANVDGDAERPEDFKATKQGPNWSVSYTCKRLPTVDDSENIPTSARQKQGCRFRIEISDTGDTVVRLTPVKVAATEDSSSRTSLGKGSWRCTHLFHSSKDLATFNSPFGNPLHASVDTAKHCVVLAPKKKEGFDNPVAQLVYPVRLKVPFSIDIDVSTDAKEGWPFLQVIAMPRADDMERPVFTMRTKSGLRSDLQFDAWSSKPGIAKGEHLVEEEAIDPTQPWEKSFRLPVPNVKSEEVYVVRIACSGPPEDRTFIHRLEATGFFAPALGIQLEQSGNRVFIKSIVPKSVASRSPAAEGDVIDSINGERPSNVGNAVEMLARTGFGDTCKIAVKRGNEAISLVLKPEWDE